MSSILLWTVPAAVATMIVLMLAWLRRFREASAWHKHGDDEDTSHRAIEPRHKHRASQSVIVTFLVTLVATGLAILSIEWQQGLLLLVPALVVLGLIVWAMRLTIRGVSAGLPDSAQRAAQERDSGRAREGRPLIVTAGSGLAVGIVGLFGLAEVSNDFVWLVPAVFGVAAILKSDLRARALLLVSAAGLGIVFLLSSSWIY